MRNWRDLTYLREGTPRQREAWQVIEASRIMDCLHAYDPVLAGTIPLDVDVADSDLDIICSCADLDVFDRVVQQSFGCYPHYLASRDIVNTHPTSLIRFVYEGFVFELFAQPVPVDQQNAYRHMDIEARLLALAGPHARSRIRSLKQNGLKTEPAFARYFNIPGDDPYQALLDWSHLADHELQKRLLLPPF